MARNSFSTGANMRGIVDVVANTITLVEPTQVNNIRNIFIDNSRVKTATDTNNIYDYNTTDISDFNVSGLSSMISYCKTHFKPIGDKSGQSITFEENNYYSKKVINSNSSSSGSKVKIVLQGEDNGMPSFIGSKSYSKSQIDTFISNLNITISGISISTLSNFTTISNLNNYYTITDISNYYFNKTDISNNYYNKTDISNNYFNKTDISNNYYNKTDISNNYYTITDISNYYFNKTDISNN